nr:hypothetical protein [Pseudonocardia sp. AL041005-10]
MPAQKKDPSVRARTNRAATATTLTRPSRKARVPAMPRLPRGETWHPEVKAWWSDVWRSPMASEFIDVDKRALGVLVVLHQDFWTATTAVERNKAATEIRLQRKDFGLTPYDRRRLEWTIEEADAATARGRARRAAGGIKQPTGAADPRRTLHAVPAPPTAM